MPNPNSFTVNPDTGLGQFINLLVGKTGKGKGTWVIWLILQTYEKEAREYFRDVLKDAELYDKLMIKYSLTAYKQIQRKNVLKEEQLKKREESNRLEREKLELAKEKEKRLKEQFKTQKENQNGEEKSSIAKILEEHKRELEGDDKSD